MTLQTTKMGRPDRDVYLTESLPWSFDLKLTPATRLFWLTRFAAWFYRDFIDSYQCNKKFF
jgi:hypothetical protein